jgi:type II secretory pathway component GspD/PulD (secretin)
MKKMFFFVFCFVLMAGFSFAQQEKTITLDVKDMELTDVIRMISDQSGLNIITSKNVKGQVTINLQDIPVEKALSALLTVNNCGFIKEGDIIQVYTLPELNQKEQFSQLYTKVFRLKFVKAVDLKQTLSSLKSGRGRMEIEPKTNTIVITDTAEGLAAIEKAIAEMDKKQETKVYKLSYAKPLDLQKNLQSIIPLTEGDFLADERTNSLVVTASPLLLEKMDVLISNWDKQIPQVLIEAKILEITLDKSRLLGVEWTYQNPEKHSLTVGSGNLPFPSGATSVEAFRIGVLNVDDYEVVIRALEGSSDTNLISSPRIVTLDNTEAKILIGSSEPYEIFHYDAEGHVTGTEVKFVEVGIKLTVTPKISQDGYITMNIRPEVSSPREGTVSTGALAIDTTEANAMMTVKNGNTLVMGGLIKDEKQEGVFKIPFLGDIPLIKYAFRNKYNKTVKKEIIIFITPKIISPDQPSLLGDQIELGAREEAMMSNMKNKKKNKK